MAFEIMSRHLGEVVVLGTRIYEDQRGYFMEAYREDQFRELGLPGVFVQDNHSYSKKGVVRGLHFQWDPPMGKLMRVTQRNGVSCGCGFAPAVRRRLENGWGLKRLPQNRKQVWAPASFARGFCALTDDVEVQYKCTGDL